MERAYADPTRHRIPWFEDDRTSYQHNAEYLRRLSKLREELIYQEKNNLSTALDRFQVKPEVKDGVLVRTRERNMIGRMKTDQPVQRTIETTMERFKRLRPKQNKQSVLLLEGKQLIEPRSSKLGNESSRSDPGISLMTETVRMSLQRMLQPAPSIPGKTRKSQQSQHELILESSAVNKRTNDDLYRTGAVSYRRSTDTNNVFGQHVNTPRSDRNHVRPIGQYRGRNVQNLTRADADELSLDPHTVRLESLDGTKTQNEAYNDCYCVYYVPTPTPITGERGQRIYSNPLPPIPKGMRGKYRAEFRTPRVFKSGSASSLPNMSDNGSPSSSHSNNSDNFTDTIKIDGRHKSIQESRKQIVVDMPTIIFKAATPEVPEIELKRQNSVITLSRTYKQNEIRQRELRNLIEDVKEINKRTETLYSQYTMSGS